MTAREAIDATATILMRMNRDERLLMSALRSNPNVGDDRFRRAVANIATDSVKRQGKKLKMDTGVVDDVMAAIMGTGR